MLWHLLCMAHLCCPSSFINCTSYPIKALFSRPPCCNHCMPVPVLAVRLQVCDQVTCPWLHSDGLVVHGDDVGADLRPVAVWLVPLQVEAGRRGMARLQGGGELQEDEGGDRVGVCCRGPETHLLAVRTGSGLIHRLRRRQKHRQGERWTGWRDWRTEKRQREG